jgi:Permuted papain-like amidase enzyme, YaeF/YiiX, C92 family
VEPRPVARMAIRLLHALADYLAQPLKRSVAVPGEDPLSLRGRLLPGDVLLSDGITRGAALVRRITRSPWAHVSMYVGPLDEEPDARCIVEADVAAGVRAVRLSELAGQRLRILRPKGLNDADRHRLAEWVVGRIGNAYDLAHAWRLAIALRLPFVGWLASAGSAMAQNTTRFICSTLLAHAFVLVGYTIPALQIGLRIAGAENYRYVTPRDFELAPVFEVLAPQSR